MSTVWEGHGTLMMWSLTGAGTPLGAGFGVLRSAFSSYFSSLPVSCGDENEISQLLASAACTHWLSSSFLAMMDSLPLQPETKAIRPVTSAAFGRGSLSQQQKGD